VTLPVSQEFPLSTHFAFSWFGGVQNDSQGLQHTPRFASMHDHTQPVGSLFATHALDAVNASLHVVAVAHGGQGSEQQAKHQCSFLVQPVDIAAARLAGPKPDATLTQNAQDSWFEALKTGPAKAIDEVGFAGHRAGQWKSIDPHLAVAGSVSIEPQFISGRGGSGG
jgi:hypothetical protein